MNSEKFREPESSGKQELMLKMVVPSTGNINYKVLQQELQLLLFKIN
jgi:hypothetical protein